MKIQIGIPCDPDYICDAIGWVLAIIVLYAFIGLVRVICKEVKHQKTKKRPK